MRALSRATRCPCLSDGRIPDIAEAVDSPQRLSEDPLVPRPGWDAGLAVAKRRATAGVMTASPITG